MTLHLIDHDWKWIMPFNYVSREALVRRIAGFASTAYRSDPDPEKLVRRLAKRGHWNMFECVSFTAHITTNIGLSREFRTYRMASHVQESTRWCNYAKKGFRFVRPFWWSSATLQMRSDWLLGRRQDINEYVALTKTVGHQGARDSLPLATACDIQISANLRSWRHIFGQRIAKDAHPEMQRLCRKGREPLLKILPELFYGQEENLKEDERVAEQSDDTIAGESRPQEDD